jgi:hypothetical protein
MATLRDFVRRFRPVATPGAAAPAGVPVDRFTELSAELAPVFKALEETNRDATQLVTDTRAEADRRRTARAEAAETVLAAAREQAEAARSAAVAAAVDEAAAERVALLDDAPQDAEEIARRADARQEEWVARVVALVRATSAEEEAVS